MEAIQQPMEVVQLDIAHDYVEESEGSQEDWQQDYLYIVVECGFALALPRECVLVFPTLSLKELPNQHHTGGHVSTFLLEVEPQGCEYIAAKDKNEIEQER